MDHISNRIKQLSESQTIAMSQRSAELKAQGKDIINLSVGQPDFHTPDHIKKAAIQAINENYTSYPPVPGYKDLREAVAQKLKRDNHLDYSFDQIIVSAGAKHSLANSLLAIVNKGDEVIVPAPYWVSYVEQVKLAEGKNVIIPTRLENNFKITPEQLKESITSKTKALMLCSPSNPTGSIYSREELEAIAKVIKDSGREIYIISDEIYEYINFKGKHQSIAEIDFIKDQVIIINGVSKGYAMTGWRIGYMAAPLHIAKACAKLQGQMTSAACSIAQRASLEAIQGDQYFTQKMKKAFKARRDLLLDGLDKIEGIQKYTPEGAFYLFPNISHFIGKSVNGKTINNDQELCFYLLDEANVALVPGRAFGSPENIRLSYAASEEELTEAIKRIKNSLEKLK